MLRKKRTTTRAYLLDALARPRRLDLAGQRRELANLELPEHSRVESRMNLTLDADESVGEIVEEDEHVGAISKRKGTQRVKAKERDGVSEGKGESASDLQPCTATGNLCTVYEILAECLRSMLRRYERLDEVERCRGSKTGGKIR